MLTSGASLLVLSLGACQAPSGCPAPPPAPAVLAAVAASAAEAAEQARRQTGGRVLSVERGSGGWQVKVLTPAGEVRVVVIPAAGG
ncbi:hypothetical protein [uncultured Thiodictyon sp.]|uniref:hypothetical protein n=1 Tax=uncultured Thiodictyon sp. TaxID=1846217 RepID=UPI0025DC3F41|nr:hypothetical protein [uncultured Thiodictyon sp.]